MEGVFQLVGHKQQVDSEKKKKTASQGQKALAYPPEDIRHANPQLSEDLFLLQGLSLLCQSWNFAPKAQDNASG